MKNLVNKQSIQEEKDKIFNDAVVGNAVIFGINHCAELVAKGNKSGSNQIIPFIKGTAVDVVLPRLIKKVNDREQRIINLANELIVSTKKSGIIVRLLTATLHLLYKVNGNKDFYSDFKSVNRNTIETWLYDGRLLQRYAAHMKEKDQTLSGQGLLEQLCHIEPFTVDMLRRLIDGDMAVQLLDNQKVRELSKEQLLKIVTALNKGQINVDNLDDEIESLKNKTKSGAVIYNSQYNTRFKQAVSDAFEISDLNVVSIPSLQEASVWFQNIILIQHFLNNPKKELVQYLLKGHPQLEGVMK